MASHIYVMGVGASLDRVRLLVESMTANGNLVVIVDPSAGGTADYYAFHNDAAAVVLVWGNNLTGEIPYQAIEEIRLAFELGVQPMVVVRLDTNVTFPAELAGAPIVDLGSWTGGTTPALTQLIDQLEGIVSLHLPPMYGETLTPWFVERAEAHVGEIGELVASLRRLDVVLTGDDIPMAQLAATLRELGETYHVVKAAIEQFMVAGLGAQGIDRNAYLRLERGKMTETIHNGRAHCRAIGVRYYREGGIRQALESRVDGELLALADKTFERLTHSDMDMLATMDGVGTALANESRSIVNLLESGQEPAARQRISQARKMLLPLEDKLDTAVANYKTIEGLIGYAPDLTPEKAVVHVKIKNLRIGGNNVGSNIIVADTIREATIMASAPKVPHELRGFLNDLAVAVAELSTKLPDDEAALAANKLKEITEEATSGRPRWAIFNDAAERLSNTATKMAAAGLPIIELINKVRELLS